MDKITLKALQLAGFQNANMIAEIISYVPNPTIAAEMLLGVHKPIDIYHFGMIWEPKRPSSDGGSLQLIKINSVNELADIVYYTRYTTNRKTVYYLTKDDYSAKVYQLDKPKDGNYYTTGSIRTKGFTLEENLSYTGVNTFESLGYKPVDPVIAIDYLAAWQDEAGYYSEPSIEVATL